MGLFAGGVASTHYGYRFLAVEESVAGCTGAHTHAGIISFIFQTQVFGCGTGRDDDRIGCNFPFLHQ